MSQRTTYLNYNVDVSKLSGSLALLGSYIMLQYGRKGGGGGWHYYSFGNQRKQNSTCTHAFYYTQRRSNRVELLLKGPLNIGENAIIL